MEGNLKKYKLIELYTNKEKPGTIEYAKVIYDDNTTETTKEIEQIKKAIRSFAEQEKISYSEFIIQEKLLNMT